MTWNEELNELRALIAAECDARITKEHRVDTSKVAEWLVRRKRTAVRAGLTDLVNQVMEQRNDDDRVKQVLRANPELEEPESVMRQMSQTLGIPLHLFEAAKCEIQAVGAEMAVAKFLNRYWTAKIIKMPGEPDVSPNIEVRYLRAVNSSQVVT